MRNPYPINPLFQLIVKVWMFFFTRYYKITYNVSKEIKGINQSYLMLSNHYGRYDPFIISYPFKKRPNFISSDSVLRYKIIGFLFKGLGAMPKKKGVKDTYIIREMISVIRYGGSLALFPEGARSWTGEINYIEGSIAKLVKLLKVPVITVRMKGAYALDPRWAKPLRRAKVDIDYQMAFTQQEIADLSEEEIVRILRKNLYQDDMSYLKEHRIKIKSRKKAEFIDLVLFQCPECNQFAGFNAKGNSFKCRACGIENRINDYGMFELTGGVKSKFDNIKDWIHWQNRNLVKYVKEQMEKNDEVKLFQANDILVNYSKDYEIMKPIGTGSIMFFSDKLRLRINNEDIDLMWKDIQVIGPQHLERIELLHGEEAYRFISTKENEAGIKWEIAANVVWYKTGQHNKLSPYFKELVAD
ncbi:MAG: lysophospholipid acyltransferase family protein [Bacteroidota bacterium]